MKIPLINELLFEYLAYWESGLKASRLARILGCSREHVQRHTIGKFERTYPVQLVPAGDHMRRLADTVDGLRFAPSRPSDLVRMLDGLSVLFQNAPDDYPFGVNIENPLSGLLPEPDPEIFRALHSACANSEALIVQYRSKQQVFPMTFSPHTLVQVPGRLHFRGYARWHSSSRKGSFIDVVPARVVSIEQEKITDAVPASQDHDWNQRSPESFYLSPDLPEHLSAVVRQEWAASMSDSHRRDMMTVPAVRKALRSYVCRALRYRHFGEELHEVWIPERHDDLDQELHNDI